MKISKAEVEHVAELSRLDLDAAAIDRFSGQIGTVLEYVDMLGAVNTEGVRPTSHAIFLTNAFRQDVPAGHLEREAALSNAPEADGAHFIVPRIIGG